MIKKGTEKQAHLKKLTEITQQIIEETSAVLKPYEYITSEIISFQGNGIPNIRVDVMEKNNEKIFLLGQNSSVIFLNEEDAGELGKIVNRYVSRE